MRRYLYIKDNFRNTSSVSKKGFAHELIKVIDKRVGRNGKTEYLLKWRGFGDEVRNKQSNLVSQSEICCFQAVNKEAIYFPTRITLGSQETTWTVLI